MMKRWSDNICLDALYKTVVIWLVLHVAFWVLGYFWGGTMSIFGFTMLWPHMETGIGGWIAGIVGALILYGAVYAYDASHQSTEER
ncbi:MAG: hypothetical protein PHE02_09000 [Lachnospiraceae bacterium]|nr:hypothetical protein [Lachnospiraceae bacterium]